MPVSLQYKQNVNIKNSPNIDTSCCKKPTKLLNRRAWQSGELLDNMVFLSPFFVGVWQIINLKMRNVGVQPFSRKHRKRCWHCVSMAHFGYGFSRWQIIDMASNMCAAIGKDTEPTKHLFYGFLSIFPDLKMTPPKKRDAVNFEMLHNYFEELEKPWYKYEIKNKPQHIWNVDET